MTNRTIHPATVTRRIEITRADLLALAGTVAKDIPSDDGSVRVFVGFIDTKGIDDRHPVIIEWQADNDIEDEAPHV